MSAQFRASDSMFWANVFLLWWRSPFRVSSHVKMKVGLHGGGYMEISFQSFNFGRLDLSSLLMLTDVHSPSDMSALKC